MTKMRDGPDGAQLSWDALLFQFFIGAQSDIERWGTEWEAGRRSEGSGVFRLVKRCVCTFFFFFFNFGLTRPFRPIRTESARFWPRRRRFPPNRRRLQPRRPDSGLATWHDAAGTRGLPRPCRVPASHRVGRGCAGPKAESVHPGSHATLRMSL